MYKVLIIEEDRDISNRIASLITPEPQGFELLGVVSNGIVGRAIMERQKPDIILLSMSAMYLGGLGFIEAVENIKYPFSIVQMYTVRSHLVDIGSYLANANITFNRNNINLQDLIRVLEEAASSLMQDKEDKFTTGRNRQLQMQRNAVILAALKGMDSEGYAAVAKRFSFNLENERLGVIIIYPAVGTAFEKKLHKQLHNLIKAVISQYSGGEIFTCENARLGAIVRLSVSRDEYTNTLLFSLIASAICEAVKNQLGIDVDCIISDEADNLNGLSKIYRSAQQLESYRYFKPDTSVISKGFLSSREIPVAFEEIDRVVLELSSALNLLKQEKIARILAHLYLSLIKSSLDFAVVQYAREKLRILYQSFVDELSVTPDIEGLYTVGSQCRTVGEEFFKMRSYFTALVQKAMEKQENMHPVIRRATAYLTKNHASELTLEQVARQVKVSPVYLSRLFRQELQKTFVDYLTLVRIEHAKRLISTGNDRIIEIARAVGYRDEKYFCRIFKRITGLPPSVYRKDLKKEDGVLPDRREEA